MDLYSIKIKEEEEKLDELKEKLKNLNKKEKGIIKELETAKEEIDKIENKLDYYKEKRDMVINIDSIKKDAIINGLIEKGFVPLNKKGIIGYSIGTVAVIFGTMFLSPIVLPAAVFTISSLAFAESQKISTKIDLRVYIYSPSFLESEILRGKSNLKYAINDQERAAKKYDQHLIELHDTNEEMLFQEEKVNDLRSERSQKVEEMADLFLDEYIDATPKFKSDKNKKMLKQKEAKQCKNT